jgi:uracil-DNA glycosylase family 4
MTKTNHPSAFEFIPERPTIPKLWEAAQGCRACDLYEHATQAVLGAGLRGAAAFFIGEQPGDQEDLAGKPFVGPAGRVLDEGLIEAGIRREEVYVTNAVKHFKWTPRGKRRIHQTPNQTEIQAAVGRWSGQAVATVHPSSILRAPDAGAREAAFAAFVADLELLYSAPTPATYHELTEVLRAMPRVPVTERIVDRALEIQSLLAHRSLHRSVRLPAPFLSRLVLNLPDSPYCTTMHWVVPRGSVA